MTVGSALQVIQIGIRAARQLRVVVIPAGAWIEPESFCRSACRLRYESHRRSDHIGFRVVVVERASR